MSAIQEAILWAALCCSGGAPVTWIDHNGAHTLNRFHEIIPWGLVYRGLDYKTHRDGETQWQVIKYTKSGFTPLEPWVRVESMHNAAGAVVSWEDSE